MRVLVTDAACGIGLATCLPPRRAGETRVAVIDLEPSAAPGVVAGVRRREPARWAR
jgi:hypothetical protein